MTAWQDVYEDLDKRASSANVIIEDGNGRLLVVKAHYKPYWSLPGGWIDADETPRVAAARELNEEIGIAVQPTELELASVIERGSRQALTHLFVFRLSRSIDSDIQITFDDGEIVEYDWVTRDDIRTKRDDRHYNRAPKNWASDTPASYLESMV